MATRCWRQAPIPDGQALFDAHDPTKLLERTGQPFFQPEAPFEMTGQYRQGTTFAEGLVFFQGKWLLYYGCADSFVAVAVDDPQAKTGGRRRTLSRERKFGRRQASQGTEANSAVCGCIQTTFVKDGRT